MSDMRSDDWRRDNTLSEAEIRRKMAEEGWERVEAVGRSRFVITSWPTAYQPPSTETRSVKVNLEPVAQSA